MARTDSVASPLESNCQMPPPVVSRSYASAAASSSGSISGGGGGGGSEDAVGGGVGSEEDAVAAVDTPARRATNNAGGGRARAHAGGRSNIRSGRRAESESVARAVGHREGARAVCQSSANARRPERVGRRAPAPAPARERWQAKTIIAMTRRPMRVGPLPAGQVLYDDNTSPLTHTSLPTHHDA